MYLVEDLHVSKLWAMKVIRKQRESRLEIEALRRLQHSSLPMIVDLIEMEDKVGIIMEYVEGETLENHLCQMGAIPQEQAVRWGIALAEVLQYLHTRTPGYMYGDMNHKIKLIDLGTVMGEMERKRHQLVGTPGYMAPEKECDGRSDIYSLGMTLHYMLTGNNPGISGNHIRPIREYNGTLSRGLEKIVERCLEDNPGNRYQTCEELKKELENYESLDQKYIWEHRVTYGTYLLLSVSAILAMSGQLYQLVETGTKNSGYLCYSMVCAGVAYLIKKSCLDRKRLSLRFYRQEISILKTEKDTVS